MPVWIANRNLGREREIALLFGWLVIILNSSVLRIGFHTVRVSGRSLRTIRVLITPFSFYIFVTQLFLLLLSIKQQAAAAQVYLFLFNIMFRVSKQWPNNKLILHYTSFSSKQQVGIKCRLFFCATAMPLRLLLVKGNHFLFVSPLLLLLLQMEKAGFSSLFMYKTGE